MPAAAHPVGALRQHHSRTPDLLAALGPAVPLLPTRQNLFEHSCERRNLRAAGRKRSEWTRSFLGERGRRCRTPSAGRDCAGQTVRALSSASSLPMVSLASPKSNVVVGSYRSSFSMPAKPGRMDRFMKTTWRAWLACRIGMP